jgi:hypothetical protein
MAPIPAPFQPGSTPIFFKLTHYLRLTKEQTMNYVLISFMEDIMFRAVVEEAAALTSITLFLGMVAIWSQVIAAM